CDGADGYEFPSPRAPPALPARAADEASASASAGCGQTRGGEAGCEAGAAKAEAGRESASPGGAAEEGQRLRSQRRCATARDRRTGVLAVYLGITCTSHPRAAPTWALSGRGMRTVFE